MKTETKKIHLVHLSSSPGGIEVLLPEVIRDLPERDISVFVVRPHDSKKPNVYYGTGFEVQYGARGNLLACWKLFLYSRRARNDIFHVFNIGPFFLLTLRAAGVRKLIYSIHGTMYWQSGLKRILLWINWKVALSKRYKITSNSLYSGHKFREKILNRNDIELLYNPINTSRYKPSKLKTRSAIPRKIIYVGRLTPGKNIMRSISVVSRLREKFPGLIYEIYGQGPEYEKLRQKICDTDNTNAIFLKGHVEKIEEIYQNADVLLFLSKRESLGNVVIESILCGTPVIVGNIPSMKEIFREYPEFIVDMDDELENNVLTKIQELDKLNSLAVKAREKFIEAFNKDNHMRHLRKLYESL